MGSYVSISTKLAIIRSYLYGDSIGSYPLIALNDIFFLLIHSWYETVTPAFLINSSNPFSAISTIQGVKSVVRYVAYFGFKLTAKGSNFAVPQPTSRMCLALWRSSMLMSV